MSKNKIYEFADLFVVVGELAPSHPSDLYTSKEEAEKEADLRNKRLVEEFGIRNPSKYTVLTLKEYIDNRLEEQEDYLSLYPGL